VDCHVCRDDCLAQRHGDVAGGGVQGPTAARRRVIAQPGHYTGWLQTSPTLGIVLSLLVIIATRTYLGEAAFNDWGWRVPFLFSFLLMFIAYYIRVHFPQRQY
jgi:MFS family permease